MSLVVHVLVHHNLNSQSDVIGVFTDKSVAQKIIEKESDGDAMEETMYDIVTCPLNMVK